MKKIMIGIPVYHGMDAQFQLSVTNLAWTLTQRGYTVDINYHEGTIVSSQRNKLAKDAKDGDYDLFFIDSDMVFSPPDAVRIIECDKAPVVAGLYFTRRPPHLPLVFKEDLTDTEGVFRSYQIDDIPADPFLCAGTAVGAAVIRRDVLCHLLGPVRVKKFGLPFNFWNLSNGDQLGEDLSFCHRLNLEKIEMACMPDVDLGHIGKNIIRRADHLMTLQRDYHYCNDIAGWMTAREQNWLYDKAKQMQSVVEIGSWKGKSTHALCCGCPGMVTAVDHFKGSAKEREGAHKEAAEHDVYAEFKANTACFKNLAVLKMSSSKASFEVGNADMVFIDGGHEYEEVLADIKAWLPKTKKLICGHDYTNFEGVHRAVNEYFGTDGVKLFDSIWFKEL